MKGESARSEIAVVLVGNFRPDQQKSMDRFAAMVAAEMPRSRGCRLIRTEPKARFSRLAIHYRQSGLPKWLGYLDKYVVYRAMLRWRALQLRNAGRVIVHIADHSNAMYAGWVGALPTVVTCHDLLAVRGALGEDVACRATRLGAHLQRWILHSLAGASHIACVSTSTLNDVRRLLPQVPEERASVVYNGLNHPFRPLAEPECRARLGRIVDLNPEAGYILHVGSNLPRKNKESLLRAFARSESRALWQLVLAGPGMNDELRSLVEELGLGARVVEVVNPDNALLEALYSGARAMVFPSISEGFGWPVIEAQACGCPVICSNTTSLPEVARDGAQTVAPTDVAGIAVAIDALRDSSTAQAWRERGLRNARRFTTESMINGYWEIYQSLLSV